MVGAYHLITERMEAPMAKKKAVRRENGRSTVEKTTSKKNPFKAKVPIGTKVDKNGKTQAIYKTLGSFPTRAEAEKEDRQRGEMKKHFKVCFSC